MADQSAIYLCVGERHAGGVVGYAWRVGSGGTSFYLKPLYDPLVAVKISLHGPDPRHPGKEGFKFGIDDTALPRAQTARGAWAHTLPAHGQWFPGREVAPGVRHVVRIRTDWTLFAHGVPPTPRPPAPKRQTLGFVVPPPGPLQAADFDLFVSDRNPYWPDERRARRDNACLGPLRNTAGQALTAVSARRSLLASPTPPRAFAPEPRGAGDRVRGLSAAIAPDGVLWVREQFLSKRALKPSKEEPSTYE